MTRKVKFPKFEDVNGNRIVVGWRVRELNAEIAESQLRLANEDRNPAWIFAEFADVESIYEDNEDSEAVEKKRGRPKKENQIENQTEN